MGIQAEQCYAIKRCKNIIMESSLWQGSSSVNIYVRSYNKNAIVMAVDTPISSRQLRQNIAARYRPSITEFALFYNGKRIDDNETLIALHRGSIIHIVDIHRTKAPEIKLTFKYHKQPHQPIKVKITSRAYIRDVLESHIKPIIGKGETEVFLVYVGRPLNIFKRFEQELVENDSEITVVQFKKKSGSHEAQQTMRECQINHTRVENLPSLKETVKNFAPAIGMRSISDTQSLKNSKQNLIAQKISPQMIEEAPEILSKGVNPFSKNKNPEVVFEETAPGAGTLYDGFNPHWQTAPGQIPEKQEKKIQNKANLKEIQEEAAPGATPLKGSPKFIGNDFIFSGEMKLQETENLLGGAVLELKEDFLKKSKSHSSEHSKG